MYPSLPLTSPCTPACPQLCCLPVTDLSLLHAGGSVQAEVPVAVVVEEGLQDVQHLGHLGEDQHAVAAHLQPTQQHVQGLQLAWPTNHKLGYRLFSALLPGVLLWADVLPVHTVSYLIFNTLDNQ